MSRALIVSAFLLFVAVVAQAQTNSSIAGAVRDTTGAILPGVTVEVASPALIERVRSTTTDGTGQYKIIELLPGVYSVTFSLPGFAAVRREGIELTTNFTAVVNADLRVGDVAETITVSGASPIVDTQNVIQQQIMTRDIVDAIPTGKQFVSLAVLIPGVQASGRDVGGSAGNTRLGIQIHGGRIADQRVLVDGVSTGITDTGGGYTMVVYPDASIQEVSIATAANSAEMETGGMRVNIIPKAGGNRFSGVLFGNYMNENLQSDNFTQDLKNRGLRNVDKMKYMYDVNPAVGGPIFRDRLWFYGGYREWHTNKYSTSYYPTNPAAWAYTPDTAKGPIVFEGPVHDGTLHLTWQASPKNKFSVNFLSESRCECELFLSPNTTFEATSLTQFPSTLIQGGWTAPLTNRWLVEVVGGLMRSLYQAQPQSGAIGPSALELNGNIEFRAREGLPGDQNEAYLQETWKNYTIRASASYVTGAHNFKFGIELNPNSVDAHKNMLADYQVQLLNGVPVAAVFFPTGDYTHVDVRKESPFVQDQWTIARRLTVNAGVRMDFLQTSYAPSVQPATSLLPVRSFPGADVLNWKDVNPRLGIAFDLFGTGKTALKASLNRYLNPEDSTNTRALNPGFGTLPLTRAWNDANHDFIPQGDALNPLPNGEFTGPSNNLSFGQPINTLHFDPKWQSGWGVRGYNWETAVGVQQEIVARSSVTASYIRRTYGNFTVDDNLNTPPTSYDPYCITTPIDSRLPNGGGQQICGLYDIKPAFVGLQGTNRLRTLASNFGNQYETWQGMDLTFTARLPRGANVQGGMSSGKDVTDNCDVVTKVNNPSPYLCHRESPFLNDFRLVGSVILPAGIELASTFQSAPNAGGPSNLGLVANYVATSASIAPSLGRPLAAGPNSTVTINVNPYGRNYNDRVNQVDLRVGRTFASGHNKFKAMLDMYNLLNASPVLVYNQSYGTTGANWLVPQSVLIGRIVKFGAQLTF